MSTTAPPPPRVMFGPYRLEGQLSHGPSATVYRAVDSSHGNRVVALKVFSPRLSADPEFRTRFRRDASRLGALREPHVVPIHRYGELDGLAYFDMRLVNGPSLAEVLRQGPLDPARAGAVAGQVRSALDAMRRAGLGNRAVAADEVLLTGSPSRGEFVQLVGLGLGRPAAPGAGSPLPEALVAAGAPPAVPSRGPRRSPGRRRLVAATATVAALGTALTVALTGQFASAAGSGVQRPTATLLAQGGMVTAADTAELGGVPVLVAAYTDGSINTFDLRTGAADRSPIPGTADGVEAVTLDGRTAVVACTADGAMVIYDLDTGQPTAAPTAGGLLAAEGAMESTTVDGAPAVVAPRYTGAVLPEGSAAPGARQVGVQLLALPGGEPLGPLLSDEDQSILGYSLIEIEGRLALVTIDAANRVVARDLRTGEAVGVATPRQAAQQLALTTTVLDGIPVAVTGGVDNVLRTWNLLTGEQIGQPLVGHTQGVTLLHTVRVGDRTVLVSSTGGSSLPSEAETAFWDLAAGAPLGPPLVGHPTALLWLTATVDGRAALIARTLDGVFTVWDAAVVAGTEQS